MTREQYAEMLKELGRIRREGGDTAVYLEKIRKQYKYVYVYNDSIFKILFGQPEGMLATAQLLNAVLKLDGAQCITELKFVDPAVQGGPGIKGITSDVVADDQKGDRIVLEVQHVGGSLFKNRLVFYVARHTSRLIPPGEDKYIMPSLNLVSLQMFDAYPESGNYRHTIQLRNQESSLFTDRQTLTLVEVEKFRKERFEGDHCALAEWLRFLDAINNETVGEVSDPLLKGLQNRAKLSNFSDRYFMAEEERMTDIGYEIAVAKEEAAKEAAAEAAAKAADDKNRQLAKGFRDDGVSMEIIAKRTGLTKEEILAL